MTTISILVGIQSDGCTFELEPRSREIVDRKGTPPDTPLPASLFIRYEVQQDFGAILGRDELLWTVAEVLTGLPREGIRQIASKVQLLDPTRDLAQIKSAAG